MMRPKTIRICDKNPHLQKKTHYQNLKAKSFAFKKRRNNIRKPWTQLPINDTGCSENIARLKQTFHLRVQ